MHGMAFVLGCTRVLFCFFVLFFFFWINFTCPVFIFCSRLLEFFVHNSIISFVCRAECRDA